MARFFDPTTGSLVQVADDFDHAGCLPGWARVAEGGRPEAPPPAGVTAEAWADVHRVAASSAKFDADWAAAMAPPSAEPTAA